MAGNHGPNSRWAPRLLHRLRMSRGRAWVVATSSTSTAGNVGGDAAGGGRRGHLAAENRATVDAYPQGWMKVEAIRRRCSTEPSRIKLTSSTSDAANGAPRRAGEAPAGRQHGTRPGRRRSIPDPPGSDRPSGMQAAAAPRSARRDTRRCSFRKVLRSRWSCPRSVSGKPCSNCVGSRTRWWLIRGLRGRDETPWERRRAGPGQRFDGAGAGRKLARATDLMRAPDPKPRQPASRRLRVYAYDPSVGARLETVDINEAILNVHWEEVSSRARSGNTSRSSISIRRVSAVTSSTSTIATSSRNRESRHPRRIRNSISRWSMRCR